MSAATPVVFKPENSVLIGPYNQDLKDLAAIDPASFERVATLSDSFFVDRSAAGAMAALQADPRGLLVDSESADDLPIKTGDRVQVLLARGTKKETKQTFHVVGLFERFPGFPQGTNLVANLGCYEAATGSKRADFFLARATDDSHAGLARAVTSLEAGSWQAGPDQHRLHRDGARQGPVEPHGSQRPWPRGSGLALHPADERRRASRSSSSA